MRASLEEEHEALVEAVRFALYVGTDGLIHNGLPDETVVELFDDHVRIVRAVIEE